jgi:hypothetical protein
MYWCRVNVRHHPTPDTSNSRQKITKTRTTRQQITERITGITEPQNQKHIKSCEKDVIFFHSTIQKIQ